MENGRRKIGEGKTAEIFEIDARKVLKLFRIGYSKNTVYQEYNNHGIVSRAMENVPERFEFVEENQRYGFVMEKIQGKPLASWMQDGDTFRQAMDAFVSLHKSWLRQTAEDAAPYQEWMLGLAEKGGPAGKTADKINRLPAGNALCHGDFHPFNIILTPAQKAVVIDFANVCRAPKEYDVARTYFLLKTAALEEPIAELYLEKMEMAYRDIRDYLEVLELLRQYETEDGMGSV